MEKEKGWEGWGVKLAYLGKEVIPSKYRHRSKPNVSNTVS